MAILRSYSATFEQNGFTSSAVTRWRFDEGTGAATALDGVGALDGRYLAGARPGDPGSIGDGAARFDGETGRVLVSDTLSGAIRVAAFGDSLVTNLGVADQSQRYVPELEAALEARGLTATVLGYGRSGDTSADGLARINSVINANPDVAIVEFGTNDARAQTPLATVEGNLSAIVQGLQNADIEVLLAGAFGFYPGLTSNKGYATEVERDGFESIFQAVATDRSVDLLDSGSDKFLGGSREGEVITGGVLDPRANPQLNLDNLHPNAAGVDDIVARTRDPVIRAAPAGQISDALELANGSVELLFTPDSVLGTQALFSKYVPGGPNPGDIEIRLDGSVVDVGLQNASTVHNVSGGSVAVGEAAHVVFTFGAEGMMLFVDGVLVDQNGFAGGLIGNLEELGIGARADGGNGFDGVIDEVALYDRALTAGEIRHLSDAGEMGPRVIGTAQADTIVGGSDDEDLRGAGGNDLMVGNGGDDELLGGGGADVLRGGPGDDELVGGGGPDDLAGGPGNDALLGMGGRDIMIGGSGDDLLEGGSGRDTLNGTSGADELFGGSGVDDLSGGSGEDLLNGGAGRDRLIGGPDSDTFEIDRIGDGADKIPRFEHGPGGDVLDLSALLAFGSADDPADFVRLTDTVSGTRVEVQSDGAGEGFTTVFNLPGMHGLDLGTLVADGNVRLEPPPAS